MPTKAKHLGLPLLYPRSKAAALVDLKERLFDKLTGWRAKLLSQVGRGTLIRSVTTPLLAYTMSFFALPSSWCKEIDRRLKNFWWRSLVTFLSNRGAQFVFLKWLVV